jgi:hypothetical protein
MADAALPAPITPGDRRLIAAVVFLVLAKNI